MAVAQQKVPSSGDSGSGERSDHDSNNALAVVALVVAAVSAGANFLMWQTMREANRETRESFEFGHRPFLQVVVRASEGIVRLDRSTPITFAIQVDNKGAGPAHYLALNQMMIQLPAGETFTIGRVDDPAPNYHDGVVSLGPDAYLTTSYSEAPAADPNLPQAFYGVSVVYRDDFGVWYRYVIAYQYDIRLQNWHVWGDRRESAIVLTPNLRRCFAARGAV